MMPVLPTYTRIFDLKMDFSTFAWASSANFLTKFFEFLIKFHIFWYQAYGQLMWNQISTLNFAYKNDQRNKIYTFGNFENKTPTQFQILSDIFKIEFPGNWIQFFISSESGLLTESATTFRYKKSAIEKSYVDS